MSTIGYRKIMLCLGVDRKGSVVIEELFARVQTGGCV